MNKYPRENEIENKLQFRFAPCEFMPIERFNLSELDRSTPDIPKKRLLFRYGHVNRTSVVSPVCARTTLDRGISTSPPVSAAGATRHRGRVHVGGGFPSIPPPSSSSSSSSSRTPSSSRPSKRKWRVSSSRRWSWMRRRWTTTWPHRSGGPRAHPGRIRGRRPPTRFPPHRRRRRRRRRRRPRTTIPRPSLPPRRP